uniref:Uncharacterized protein n=1 Tax=Bicosoecida sp. CB-2014 TaxID=1486930 RepID=A0A7S1G4G8_9STRA|mmetsp:Transcript_10900/g.37971  ORF Transcript_10900/g.37971 Transcript_10900/m.37971 type:complete len:186 (+) Transcript_10900:207-764(+)
MARESKPLLGKRATAKDELRQPWPRTWVADHDGKFFYPAYQPMPPDGTLLRDFAVGRSWESAIKHEWQETTVLEVATRRGVSNAESTEYVDVDAISEALVEEAEREIDIMSVCVYCRHQYIKETPWAKWCFSERELWVENLKYVARFLTGPIPAMWPGVAIAKSWRAAALAREGAREDAESKKDA